ncbi:MAG: BadF/BadG/BcrA/BcrD ATPase family protein [Lachnospira pectinoschiza]
MCHTIKFCDYYGFAYRHGERKGETLLKIETDCTPQSSGQLHTRIDAFAETIGAGANQIKKSENIHYIAGVDSGSTSTDAVILDREKKIVSSVILPTGAGAASGAEKALAAALESAGLKEDLDAVVTTGYGRETVGLSDASATEITCHAKERIICSLTRVR